MTASSRLGSALVGSASGECHDSGSSVPPGRSRRGAEGGESGLTVPPPAPPRPDGPAIVPPAAHRLAAWFVAAPTPVRSLTIGVTILALSLCLAASCVSTGRRPPTNGGPPGSAPTGPAQGTSSPPGPGPSAERPPPQAPAPPETRVVLTAVTKAGRAAVTVSGGWTLRAHDGSELRAGRGLRGELDLAGAAPVLAAISLPADGATLVPADAGDLRIDARRYPGVLRIDRAADGRARAAIDVDAETYLEGVVAGELPPDFPREARRAQAIIARTYLLAQPSASRGKGPILIGDSGASDQEFVGIAGDAKAIAAVRDAVRSTAGLVLHDGARAVDAWYHSTCGGHTTASGPVFDVPQSPVLRGVPCTTCTSSKYFRWTSRIAGAKVAQAAKLPGPLESFRVASVAPEGRALTFEVRAGGQTATVAAPALRLAVGGTAMRSTWIEQADVQGAELVLAGRGWGHGVGLCQVGARGLADRGDVAEDIVTRYYPGAVLTRRW